LFHIVKHNYKVISFADFSLTPHQSNPCRNRPDYSSYHLHGIMANFYHY